MNSQTYKDIIELLSLLLTQFQFNNLIDVQYVFIILITLFNLKEIIKHFDNEHIINYIYYLFLISRPNDFDLINECFAKYTSVIKNKFSINVPIHLWSFFSYFSDIICIYYLSYLDDTLIEFHQSNETIKFEKNNLSSSLTQKTSCSKIIIEK